MTEQIQAGRVKLVGDLTGVDYTSSAGLRALLASVKDSRSNGGDLRLAGIQKNVHKVLEMSGFTSILKSFANVEQAVASFGG
jgi:anti-anti-sigma factor